MMLRGLALAALVGGKVCGGGVAAAALHQPVSHTAPPAPQPAVSHARHSRPLTRGERLGRVVFHAAGCADCHTLAAAHAHGNVGPNLDHVLAGLPRSAVVRLVEHKVLVGGGGMMPFGIGMAPIRIHRVAAYVARAVHAPGDGSR
jgi:mono/diheme cytochrome c family protein